MDKYLERMGNNFLVAALIPSLAFVTLCAVIFGPIIPKGVVTRLESTFNPLGQSWLLLLLGAVIIGFALSSLNTFIYKLFEGYMVLARVSIFRCYQKCKAGKLRSNLKQKQEILAVLRAKKASDSQMTDLEDQVYYIRSELDQRFPPSDQAILPTEFGNRFRAAEYYPASRYGIDSVRMWPRLVHVIPNSYYEKLDQSNNQLGFLVNCSVLALLFAGLCSMASIYQFLYMFLAFFGMPSPLYFAPIDVGAYIYIQRVIIYAVTAVIGLGGFLFFYQASLPIVSQYGNLIRSAYDLFRFDLLKALHMSLPKCHSEEYDLWCGISELMACGDPSGTLEFEYMEY
jgi:hypothetical protein